MHECMSNHAQCSCHASRHYFMATFAGTIYKYKQSRSIRTDSHAYALTQYLMVYIQTIIVKVTSKTTLTFDLGMLPLIMDSSPNGGNLN